MSAVGEVEVGSMTPGWTRWSSTQAVSSRHAAKVEVRIFDYVDSHVPMLARMFVKRLACYRAMGYELADRVNDGAIPESGYSIEYDPGIDKER